MTAPHNEKHLVKIIFTVAFFSIVAGGLVYLGCRPTSLYLFKWCGIDEATPWLSRLREFMEGKLPYWAIYELPAGLWAMSYALFILPIWQFNLRESIPYLSVIPTLGLISEILQLFGMIPGNFDIIDIVSYLLGTALGIGLPLIVRALHDRTITNKNNTKIQHYEKKYQ